MNASSLYSSLLAACIFSSTLFGQEQGESGQLEFRENVMVPMSDGVRLYAGGDFWTASGVKARGIAMWDGSMWHALVAE